MVICFYTIKLKNYGQLHTIKKNFQSPFKFEWVETASEDMQNPYQNMDERVQRVRIMAYIENLPLSEVKCKIQIKG